MMMISDSKLLLGYDYDAWYLQGAKEPISIEFSRSYNSSLICQGLSGSGKSLSILTIMARLSKFEGIVFFADFKQDDNFTFLRDCPRYYPYYQAEEALEAVYSILQLRQSGKDSSRYPVTLIFDEYMAFVLSLLSFDKKKAERVMRQVGELLMLGRSLNIRLWCLGQRGDALVFPSGSRINFGVCIFLGAALRSSYEMFMPKEFIDKVGDRHFKAGEGVVILQGSQMRFIKMPIVKDENKLQALCIDAITRPIVDGDDGEAVKSPTSDIVLPDVHTHKQAR